MKGGQCTDYVYCGKKHGIIMSDFDGLWQLKLDQISDDQEYIFSPLSPLSEFAEHRANNMSMCYMKGVDKLLTVDSIKNVEAKYDSYFQPRRTISCGIYDFETNKWINIEGVGFMSALCSCSMVYDYHNRSNIYLLSDTGILASYHVFKDKWINLYHGSKISNLYQMDKKFILWLDNKNTNILYYAALKVSEMINKYDIDIYSFDVRSDEKKWNQCFKYWDDLSLPNSDRSVQLFK